MSIEILPQLIREKLDYYLYFRVWKNHIKCVNLEYEKILNKFTIPDNFINRFGFCIRFHDHYCKQYNYREKESLWVNKNIRDFRDNIVVRDNIIVELPKHYYDIILKEIL